MGIKKLTLKDGTIAEFTEVYNNDLSELRYSVMINEKQFIMEFDNDKLHLAVVRPAPYLAYEYEIELADLIQAYNDDML